MGSTVLSKSDLPQPQQRREQGLVHYSVTHGDLEVVETAAKWDTRTSLNGRNIVFSVTVVRPSEGRSEWDVT